MVKEYPGDYNEFNRWYTLRQQELQANQAAVKQEEKQAAPKKQKKEIAPTELSRLKKELNSVHKKLQQVEKEVIELETKIANSETEMAKPAVFGDPYKLAEINEVYDKQKAQLAKKNTEWEKLAEEVEALEDEIGG
jgi:ATP-binding cassette subfamily F protein 3